MQTGLNTILGHNSIILTIEAQALYIDALINKIREGKRAGRNLHNESSLGVVKTYNEDLSSPVRLSFYIASCNSWYKNEAGLTTNNWSDTVSPYQKRPSSIQWDELDVRVLKVGSMLIRRDGHK